MDKSASMRPPEGAGRSPETKIPPLTLKSLGELLGHKNIEETKVFVESIGGRKKLLETMKQKDPQALERYKLAGRDIETEVDELYKTFEAKTTWLGKSWNFVKRHKWKIIGGALAVGAGAAAWYYWPQITAWAAGAGEAARQWVKSWLGIPDVKVPGAPDVPAMPEVPGSAPSAGPQIAPPPREVLPGSMPLPTETPGLEKALDKLK